MKYNANIHYYDIGDYLDRQQKLAIIKEFGSVANPKMRWQEITPNEKGDWINQRDGVFDNLIPLAPEKKFDAKTQSFFVTYAIGLASNRDSWVYNYSRKAVEENMKRMIGFYNEQRELYDSKTKNITSENKPKVEDIVSNDSCKISWTRGLRNLVKRNFEIKFDGKSLIEASYRPFQKQILCNIDDVIEAAGLGKILFPTPETKNLVICVSGIASSKDFTTLILNSFPSLDFIDKTQCFPLYYYEDVSKNSTDAPELDFDGNSQFSTGESQLALKRHDGISDWILQEVRHRFSTSGKSLTKEHIFYYVYGILHSKQYRERFASDLKKSLPRLPIVDDINTFMDFYNAGKRLADLHLNYETVPAYDSVVVETLPQVAYKMPNEKPALNYGELLAAEPQYKANGIDEYKYYAVEKMRFPQKGQKDIILYNHFITIKNIPAKAYDYIVNGKSAIEWLMERYAITTDKASTIKNDPNDWSREHKPRYIFDLLLSVINVSVQTVEIVDGLPKVEW